MTNKYQVTNENMNETTSHECSFKATTCPIHLEVYIDDDNMLPITFTIDDDPIDIACACIKKYKDLAKHFKPLMDIINYTQQQVEYMEYKSFKTKSKLIPETEVNPVTSTATADIDVKTYSNTFIHHISTKNINKLFDEADPLNSETVINSNMITTNALNKETQNIGDLVSVSNNNTADSMTSSLNLKQTIPTTKSNVVLESNKNTDTISVFDFERSKTISRHSSLPTFHRPFSYMTSQSNSTMSSTQSKQSSVATSTPRMQAISKPFSREIPTPRTSFDKTATPQSHGIPTPQSQSDKTPTGTSATESVYDTSRDSITSASVHEIDLYDYIDDGNNRNEIINDTRSRSSSVSTEVFINSPHPSEKQMICITSDKNDTAYLSVSSATTRSNDSIKTSLQLPIENEPKQSVDPSIENEIITLTDSSNISTNNSDVSNESSHTKTNSNRNSINSAEINFDLLFPGPGSNKTDEIFVPHYLVSELSPRFVSQYQSKPNPLYDNNSHKSSINKYNSDNNTINSNKDTDAKHDDENENDEDESTPRMSSNHQLININNIHNNYDDTTTSFEEPAIDNTASDLKSNILQINNMNNNVELKSSEVDDNYNDENDQHDIITTTNNNTTTDSESTNQFLNKRLTKRHSFVTAMNQTNFDYDVSAYSYAVCIFDNATDLVNKFTKSVFVALPLYEEVGKY